MSRLANCEDCGTCYNKLINDRCPVCQSEEVDDA